MAGKCGRPAKNTNNDSKQAIISATIALIKESGSDSITIRKVCEKADLSIGTFYHHFRDKDDLMMYFLRETSFEEIDLQTELSDVAGRISELYLHLVNRYIELGLDFMKSFYSTGNISLSAYMGEKDGAFEAGTVMARCEVELHAASKAGYLTPSADIHCLSMDICTIVKGCVFEWCLNNGKMDIQAALHRIIKNYLFSYTRAVYK